jgi:CRP/FNR family transcriptional regulator, cyclic AMP receptor protein
MSFFDYPTGTETRSVEQHHLLADCPEEDWAVVLRHTRSLRFRAGDAVLEPTIAEQALYLVIEGTLEATLQAQSGRGRPSATFASGTVIGELSFFDGHPRSVLVRAVTDGELARLGVEDLEALADSQPSLARAILFDLGRILALRLRHVQSHPHAILV